jgi:hydroxyacyl-ACP dehydratase HTD2-like protein with hotdog domain
MTMLQARIRETRPGWRIKRLDYRNVAPLYVGEPMKLCGREGVKDDEVHLWIENGDGVQAVRGTAVIES